MGTYCHFLYPQFLVGFILLNDQLSLVFSVVFCPYSFSFISDLHTFLIDGGIII
jgi:hypothetical protein